MSFRKGLSKYLKNTAYKHSLANRPAENGYYILYSYMLAPIKYNNSFKFIITFKIIKDI